ncbi:MAG: choice-of-anchor tandem repeat GloVer-containing protein [Methylocella sp.]
MGIGRARRNWFLARIFVPGAGALIATALVPCSGAAAYQEKVLYSFCPGGGTDCTDGSFPVAGLIGDASGNLYGTTAAGGAQGDGTVFELTPNAAKTGWTNKVLYSFCALASCTDGEVPLAGLIMDAPGNLYGTTYEGGSGGDVESSGGTVFELIPNAAKTAWAHKVLYSFCAKAGCTGGVNPNAGVIMDASGNLYGTTVFGAVGGSGGGTVFELTPNAAKTAWTETVLHSFCSQANCADGANPEAGLIRNASGNLYGTTAVGGAFGDGTVFELKPNAAKTEWTHKVLYSFCAQAGCPDGEFPDAGLIGDASGNLYGTTFLGGAAGAGTVFELTANKTLMAWTETVLYSFCALASCTDGSRPYAGLIRDASGNLYGTTLYGGITTSIFTSGSGTVFELTPNAAKTAWTETVLHSFCSPAGCADGANPEAGLIRVPSGNLYGTSVEGGISSSSIPAGAGVVFELVK